MNLKKQTVGILIVALSLATAWAIRGKFGHEQGAAWAGVIGGLALVLVSQRKDWYQKMALVALASALGWGAGGMISYGMVVGYGRSDDFLNAFYGLGMLFVIGALFGVLGGGLVGLVLDSTKGNKVRWGALFSEMAAGGLVSYLFLVEQIGFKMTPPRSEAWAIILGAGLAMLWHMARENRNSPIRVAIFSALGGGFGFAFGNFLQVLGNVFGVPFNMWNVMEYSIGFFGGSAMAYAVFSSVWPVDDAKPSKWSNRVALLVISVFIPLIVYRESLAYEPILKHLGDIPDLEATAYSSALFAAVALVVMAILFLWRLWGSDYGRKEVLFFFFGYLGLYTLMAYVIKGFLSGHMLLENHLYIANMLLLFSMLGKAKAPDFGMGTDAIHGKKWLVCFLAIVAVIALFSLIAVSIHGEMPHGHNRF